jgi:tetratricopeptide (TPR) repeat protein
MTRFWQSSVILIATSLVLAATAQPYPKFESRAAAVAALGDADARIRLGGVVYFGNKGLATDGPLLIKRLTDGSAVVREAAQEAVWLAWSRSGDVATDQLLSNGVAKMNTGHPQQAIEIFTAVIKRNPDFAEGWNKRATAYYQVGEMRKSLADCDEVMKRNPQHFGALSGYGQIYIMLEDYEKAIAYFQRALAVNPNMSDLETAIPRLEEILRERLRRTV